METTPQPLDSDEIDVRDIVLPLWNNRWFILKVTGFFGILGIVVAFLRTPEYTANITFIPQTTEKSGSLGNLGGLAAMAGINLQGLTSSSEIPPTIYPKIISSTVFRKNLLGASLTESSGQKISYQQYLLNVENEFSSLIFKYTLGLPGQIVKLMSGNNNSAASTGLPQSIYQITEKEFDYFEILDDKLAVSVDKKENSVQMSFTMNDPVLAAQMVQTGYSFLQKELIQYKVELARQQLVFIEGQLKLKKEAFEGAQARLSAFRDQNQNLSLARAINREEELEAEYNLAFNLYSEFSKQFEQAKIQVSKDTPIFSVIQPVTVPIKKSSMGKSVVLLISLLLGLITSIAYIFLRSTLLNKEFWLKSTK